MVSRYSLALSIAFLCTVFLAPASVIHAQTETALSTPVIQQKTSVPIEPLEPVGHKLTETGVPSQAVVDPKAAITPLTVPEPYSLSARDIADELGFSAVQKPRTSADEKLSGSSRYESSNSDQRERFHWGPAIAQSMIFLGVQHAVRMTQKKTTEELGGPFFKDWFKSVRGLKGWRDGDSLVINYVAHPLQGGLTGRIFINNSDNARKQEFGRSTAYWTSRLKAMAWSAVWRTQFELGPISEASIGNVGLRQRHGENQMGYVDLVITPTVGTGVLVLEDMADKFLLRDRIERKFGPHSATTKFLRVLLTPTTAAANILRGKPPWKRLDR